MPWLSNTHNALGSSSRSVSRPASRPVSPTLSATHPAGTPAFEPLADYFTPSRGASIADTPGSTSTHNSQHMGAAPSVCGTPAATTASPLEIFLESDNLTLRGQGADMAPAYLSGYLSLYLAESTNIKDVSMVLTGKAKVHFSDTSSHSYTHNIIQNEWTFLEGNRKHAHTLKAGVHNFPFSFTLEGALPSSITTPSGDGRIEYKLRANVVRAGLGGLSSLGSTLGLNNLSATRLFTISRMYTPEALEFNQTLEIENTWPGKIMYSITLPYKAYAAGDTIPVIVKFMPIAKGVRVLSVTSSVKEYSTVWTRGSSHAETRNAITVKHEIHGGHAVLVDQETTRPPHHWTGPRENEWNVVAGSAIVPTPPRGSSEVVEGASGSSDEPEAEPITGDDEVCTSLTIPIPPWTTPSHSIKPVQMVHKIKWSCAIANPDGHVSELRCALPIQILDHRLLDEARLSGAPARNLMLGTTAEEAPQLDLPSYSNHVYDRVAVPEPAGSSGFSMRSIVATPRHSPDPSPPHSRPSSPRQNRSFNDDLPPRRQLTDLEAAMLRNLSMAGNPPSGQSSRSQSGPDTPYQERSRGGSHRGSRAGSAAGSRVGSRAGSRASSPERHHGPDDSHPERRAGLSHFLHSVKPLATLSGKASPILRQSSGASTPATNSPTLGASPRTSISFSQLPTAAVGERERSASVTFAPSSLRNDARGTPLGLSDDEYDNSLSRVPSYNDEAQAAFVVPLDPALPTYIDSQEMERARSDAGHTVEAM